MDILERTSAVSVEHLWIELTHRCNLTCQHCYTNSGPEIADAAVLNEEAYKKIIMDARRLGAYSIQFIGGEPVLSAMLPSLLREAVNQCYERIEVYSNLISLPLRVLEAILETKACIATSLYADNAAAHDAVTGQLGSFKKTTVNIKRLVALNVDVRAGIVDVHNNADQVEAAEALAWRLGVHHVSTDRARPFGRLGQSVDENSVIRDVCGKCWSGKLCIDPSGLVSPCIMSKKWPIGSVLTQSLLELVDNGVVTSVREQMSRLFASQVGEVEASCDPNDRCGPRACKPQYDGPPNCAPAKKCAPELWEKTEWQINAQIQI